MSREDKDILSNHMDKYIYAFPVEFVISVSGFHIRRQLYLGTMIMWKELFVFLDIEG